MLTEEDNRAIMHNLSFNRIANSIESLNRHLADYTKITREAITSTDKGSRAMIRLTRALIFVGLAQVVATIAPIFIK